MPEAVHPGGCSCGRVRYRITRAPLIVHACHCRMCQRLSGSTHAVNVLVEADHVVQLSGETTEHVVPTPSGCGQRITRCAHCHDALWSAYLAFTDRFGAEVRFVRAGTLDHPERLPPDVHIFTDSRQPHAVIADKRPRFAGFYDLTQVWPDESVHRLHQMRRAPGAPLRQPA